MALGGLFQIGLFHPYSTCVIVVGTVWLSCAFLSGSAKKKRSPLPPGPVGLPIIGNLLEKSGSKPWIKARELGEKYGDLVYMDTLGMKILFVNSYPIANELLDHRSAIYSSRPPFVLAKKRVQLGGAFVSVQRRFEEVKEFDGSLSTAFLRSVLQTPENYEKYIRRLAGSLIMTITYGHEVKSEDDAYIKLADDAVRHMGIVLEAVIFDIFPLLRFLPEWLPGTKILRKAREGRKTILDSCYAVFNSVKSKHIDGTAVPCMTTHLLDKLEETNSGLDEELLASTAGTMYLAGSETVSSTVLTCILAMMLYPDVMKRAQDELDRVVGKNCLPSFKDRENLPYINAICLECLRWEVVLPLGVPHTLERDDVYNGYLIPAGTTVYPNQWAMSMDDRLYDSPEEFIPERWIQKDRPLLSSKFAFGFGRRICAGKDFAESTVYIVIASLLACFNIEKTEDEFGKPIKPDRKHEPEMGIVRRVTAPQCKISPRSDSIARLISASAASLD